MSKENRDELRRLIKETPEAFFESDGSGKGYICPLCNSGGGKHGSGMTIKRMASGNVMLSCWSCGFKGDVLEMLKESRGLDFNEALEYGADVLGRQDLLGKEIKPPSYRNPPKPAPVKVETEEQVDYTAFFDECRARIEETDYHRGLSIETLRRFYVGYHPKWRHPSIDRQIRELEAAIENETDETAKKKILEEISRKKAVPYSPRLIIPTSKSSYLARDTRGNLTGSAKEYAKQKVGKVHLFNGKALRGGGVFFAVEGEIDCLSIIDAGGQAVGLGSKGNGKKLIEALKKVEVKPEAIIIALDNEEGTRQQAAELEAGIKELGIAATVKNEIFSPYKDANEYLLADRQGFKAMIEREITSSKTESSISRLGGEIREGESMNDKLVDREVQEGVQGKYEANRGKLFEPISDFLTSGEFQREIEGRKKFNKLKIGFSNMEQPLYPGLYLLGSIPGGGKTTLALQIADHTARQGELTVFISYEQPKDFLTAKILSRESYLLSEAGEGEAITATQIVKSGSGEALTKAIEKYKTEGKNLIIYEASAKDNIDTLIEKIEAEFLSKGIKPIIFLDYLQRIPSKESNGRKSTKEVVDDAVFKLNQFQRKYNLILWVISSFNRDNYLRQVDYESFKESGGIEYTADVVYGLQLEVMNEVSEKGSKEIDSKRAMVRAAKKMNPRKTELVCLKNRYGAIGEGYHFLYYPAFDYFEPFEPKKAETKTGGDVVLRAESRFKKKRQPPPPPPDEDFDYEEIFDDE